MKNAALNIVMTLAVVAAFTPGQAQNPTFAEICSQSSTVTCWDFESNDTDQLHGSENDFYYYWDPPSGYCRGGDQNALYGASQGSGGIVCGSDSVCDSSGVCPGCCVPNACLTDSFLLNHPNGGPHAFKIGENGFRQGLGNTIAFGNQVQNMDRCVYPKRVADEAADGNHSVLLSQPSNSYAGASGDFSFVLKRTPDGQGGYRFLRFGRGAEFWVRWRMKQNAAMIDPTLMYTNIDGENNGGIKKIIIQGLYPNDKLEATMVDPQHTRLMHMYSDGGGGEPHAQNDCYVGSRDRCGEDYCPLRGDTCEQFFDPCHYVYDPTCATWARDGVPDPGWRTYQVHIKVADNVPACDNGLLELYVDDDPTPVIVDTDVRHDPGNGCDGLQPEAERDDVDLGDGLNGYSQITLVFFATGKWADQSHPEGKVWYDNIIVSRTKVPPLQESSSGGGGPDPTEPPLPPLGVQVE